MEPFKHTKSVSAQFSTELRMCLDRLERLEKESRSLARYIQISKARILVSRTGSLPVRRDRRR